MHQRLLGCSRGYNSKASRHQASQKIEPTTGMWSLYIAGLKRKFIHLYVVVSQSSGDPEPIANPNEQVPWSRLVQIWTV